MKRKADVDLTEEEPPLKKQEISFLTKVWVHYHASRTGRYHLYHLTFNEPWKFGQTFQHGQVSSLCRCLYTSQTPYGSQWTSFRIPTYDECWLTMYEPEEFRRASQSHLEGHFRGSAAATKLVLQYVLPTTTVVDVQDMLYKSVKSFEVKLSPANLYENNTKKFWPKGIPVSIIAKRCNNANFLNYGVWCLDETATEFKTANKHRLGIVPGLTQLYYEGTLIPDTTTLRGLGADITANCCTIHIAFI